MKRACDKLISARGVRVAVLRSCFNKEVVDGLMEGAMGALAEMGIHTERVSVFDVPGAFELPLAAQMAARMGRYDALVALGAVIRGETDHYEHIAREAVAGLAAVSRETNIPIGLGVLTVTSEAHALARSARNADNKGAEAARAAVAMALFMRRMTPARRLPHREL
ncbi:MAG: 6,7-dimethyl-8-ribityllumazine synthase [Vicinamibacteria bacterium]|nr:6,7-dimethyl-8-ribityllumazine synthase [Vicinamibacteria bacterium]